jgi:hypothetical protein
VSLDGARGGEYCWVDASSVAGGGGGAVGRVRVNTVETYAPSCVISPSVGTAAFSQGEVPMAPLP